MTEVADTLDFLLGGWAVERTLTDYRSGLRGLFHGTADLRVPLPGSGPACPGHARYEEAGLLRFGGYQGTAVRRLDLLRLPDAAVAINFTDGRKFVDCDLRSGSWSAEHRCGKDRYELTFSVRSPDVFDEHWRVLGPAKDYTAWTTLRRLQPAHGHS